MWRPFVALLFCVGTLATWRGCGDSCHNSNECDDALCSKCEGAVAGKTGICVSGLTCNNSCTVDSDCERLRYCYSCTVGKCVPGPAYPHQCKNCVSDAQCDRGSTCSKCLKDITIKNGSRCAAGCDGTCTNNYDCGYGTDCSRCDLISKTCKKGGGCGTICGTDADCDSNGICKNCIDFICSVPCNSTCKLSSECNAPVTGCGVCRNSLCQPGVECGSRCVYDRDCVNAGSCTTCFNSQCVGGGQCGKTCTTSGECGRGNCPVCTNGKCTVPQCGALCQTNSECAGAGNCTSCTNGKCTTAQCGSQCQSDIECDRAASCRICLGGACSTAQCGTPCVVDADCAHAGKCTICPTGKCEYQLPTNCGIHHPCTPGNNNECPSDSCSRCDPFTATCRLGGECGAACIVSTDCNQMGACPNCVDICVDRGIFMAEATKRHGPGTLKELQEKEDQRRLMEVQNMSKS